MSRPFALWITGLPAAGKSTLASRLVSALRHRGIDPAVLESDAFRRSVTPQLGYSQEDRRRFYEAMIYVGGLLYDHSVPVLFDATAPLREYRQAARRRFPVFFEIFVDCPVEVCRARDPKGLYRGAAEGRITALPGVQIPYEPPERPDVRWKSDREDPEKAVRQVLDILIQERLLSPRARGRE
jgi:adenylylsulfate kinase